VIFQPLRERLQHAVNRLMYGERDDPYSVLSRLGHRLEETIVPDAVLPTLVETVARTWRLPYAAVRLELPGDPRGPLSATYPVGQIVPPPEQLLHIPIIYQREILGRLGYDRVSGEFTVEEKGNVVRLGRLGDRARKYMRAYLARRPERAKTDQLWVTERGTGPRQFWHGNDHATGQEAERHYPCACSPVQTRDRSTSGGLGAAVGEIQTLLGHSTPALARRYAGQALNRQGAKLIVQYSPLN
jgi:hypothetical protein